MSEALSSFVDGRLPDSMEALFHDVVDLHPENFNTLQKSVIDTKGDFTLCSESPTQHHIVLHKKTASEKAYSMIRVKPQVSVAQLNLFSEAIQPLVIAAGRKLLDDRKLLEGLADSLRLNPGWHAAHLAAKFGMIDGFETDAVNKLLNQADENTGLTPLMVAVAAKCNESVKKLLALRVKLDAQDKKGDTAFHQIVRTKGTLQPFYEADEHDLRRSLNIANNDGKTPFQLAIDTRESACALRLLMAGTDPDRGLRLAIEAGSIDLVKMAIVVGADVNKTDDGISPLQLVERMKSSDAKDAIKDALTRVGARLAGETAEEELRLNESHQDVNGDEAKTIPSGDRVLCLDGGGIKGLAQIQLLRAIEKSTGMEIKDCFEWISGTSIGGIMALLIAKGKTVQSLMGLIFELKDQVFVGKPKPFVYSSEPLEKLLKDYCEENTLMSDLPSSPRVIVTAVVGDIHPPRLHLFRSYEVPENMTSVEKQYTAANNNNNDDNSEKRLTSCTNTRVWEAGRATSAAPTYFPCFENFMDGGLIANNPTLDTLTEIHRLNDTLELEEKSTQPIQVVVSLGTGMKAPKEVSKFNITKSWSLKGLVDNTVALKNLIQLLSEQCTTSNGQCVERAASWCQSTNTPYYRLNPEISDINMDCRQDSKIVNMMFEAQCHVYENRDRIAQLGHLLTQHQKSRPRVQSCSVMKKTRDFDFMSVGLRLLPFGLGFCAYLASLLIGED